MNDPELRAYLLGRLPETEAARLEERLLDDGDLFEILLSVEDDLVDEFARGHLSDADARAFASRTNGRESRVLFSQALSKRTRKVALSRSYRIPLAIAATLVLALGLSLVFTRPVQAPVPESVAKDAASVDVVLAVTIATARSAGSDSEIVVPKAAARLRLRVTLDPEDRFDRYRVELRSPLGNPAYREDDLRAATEAGAMVLNAVVPASVLGEGAHELEVSGLRLDGSSEPLGFATVRIRRLP